MKTIIDLAAVDVGIFMRVAGLAGMLTFGLPGRGPGHTVPASPPEGLRLIIAREVERRPRMQVQDLYKLLHQAALGSEQAVEDVEKAREWLDREIRTIGEGREEALLDTISPGGQLVRVNLRPYLQDGGDPDALLRAFVRTANEYPGSTERLRAYLQVALEMADAGTIPLGRAALEAFFDARSEEGYPAVHHSPAYQAAYAPAYRVVDQQFLEAPVPVDDSAMTR